MFIPRPPLTVLERFAGLIMVARKAVGEAMVKKGLPVAIAELIDGYLRQALKRFARLVAMAANGTLLPPRKRPKPAEGGPERPQRPPRPKPLLRTWGYCWIVKRAQGAVTAGSLLRALLDDPEMIALVALDPRFSAMLRPLLSGLATTPDPGQLPPPPPRAPRAPREPKPVVPKPPRKVRAKKVRWWCAKPPRAGLIFSDESLN